MTTQVVLLRGVNVQGTTMKMADLRQTLHEAGFPDARTVLASGNVVLTDERAGEQIREVIEAVLRKRFNYEAWVQVIDRADLTAIADAYPFDTDESTHHPYVVFCRDTDALAEVVAHLPQPGNVDGDAVERIRPGERVLYWEAPKGQSTDTAVSKMLNRRQFKAGTTTRNLRTVRKLLR